MAKMFYSLEEAALKLHLSEEDIREMAASGQLQQFRDRDKLMFKREQIDDLADASGADSGGLVERESVEDIFADDTIPYLIKSNNWENNLENVFSTRHFTNAMS